MVVWPALPRGDRARSSGLRRIATWRGSCRSARGRSRSPHRRRTPRAGRLRARMRAGAGLIEQDVATSPGRTAAGLPLEGRPPPPDLRLRGRLARARHRDDRADRRRARPVVLRHRARDPDPRRGDGRGRRPGVRRRAGAARRPRGPQPRGRPGALRRPDARSSSGSRPLPTTRSRRVLSEAYAAPIREELVARRIEEIHAAGSKAAVAATPGAPRGAGARSAPSTARTCSSSSRRSARRATSRPATTRCRSRSSPGSCRSRSRSATRPAPRPRTC